MIVHLIVGLIKKTLYKNELILSKTFNTSPIYATKADIKNISHVDESSFALV